MNTLDLPVSEQLCRHYGLGDPVGESERIQCGLRHRMYRLRTARGEFAVKLLSANALEAPGERERVRMGEQVAAAVAAAGLPAVAALQIEGEPIQRVVEQEVLVFPWVEGQLLTTIPVPPPQAQQIGQILGQMHRLPLQFPELPPMHAPNVPVETWMSLIAEAEATGVAWAEELRAALPELSRWDDTLAEAKRLLPDRWVVSHADLHQQNVLWSDEQTPWLIDWEAAGLQQPAREAVVSALEWSGFVEGEPDLETFRAFLTAYRAEAPLSAEEVWLGLRICLGNWLGWMQFCAERSLASQDPEEREGGARQVKGTLATIRRAERYIPVLEQAGT